MNGWTFVFEPWLPLWLIASLALVGLAAVVLSALARAAGTPWRALALAVLIAALLRPVLQEERREPLPDVVVTVVDESPSMDLPVRRPLVEEARAHLQDRLGDRADIDLREVLFDETDGNQTLTSVVEEALADVDRRRLGGVMVLGDGQNTLPEQMPAWLEQTPLHALLAGEPGESDRRLIIERMPHYAMVGEPQELTLRVDDDVEQPVTVDMRRDGELIERIQVEPGRPATVPFELDHAGETVIELEVPERAGEISGLNNRAVAMINGVRDRLRVLLVSGQPHPGLRVWRNLLKADPAVDLVHFTILRPPEKQDGTPVSELALIAFPVRELFEIKLDEFDLVIFDRYARRGLLPIHYLDNVAAYVERGGGVLITAGPEFANPLSLVRTPLQRALPARPSGRVYEQGFMPRLTDLGERHPVTHGLDEGTRSGEGDGPGWGRWFRMVDVEADGAPVVMEGVADRPLLVLDRVGEGRAALMLSDHAWLWARGFEDGGPQALLLRRLVHWLMKEPELDEERLSAFANDQDRLEITKRSLDPQALEVTITHPNGDVRAVELEPTDEPGIASAEIEVDQAGLFQIDDGASRAFAAVRPMPPRELADLRASAAKLEPWVEASGGDIVWLGDEGLPSFRSVGQDRSYHGRGWLGLVANERAQITGSQRVDLLPAWLAFLLLVGTITLAWWREARR